MPRWKLENGRPVVELEFTRDIDGKAVKRGMLAATGGGATSSPFDVILARSDVREFLAGNATVTVSLGGALLGRYPCAWIAGGLPGLPARPLVAVSVPDDHPLFHRLAADGADGLAGLRFLDRYHYGNFGHPGEFGIEPLPDAVVATSTAHTAYEVL